MTKDVFSHNLKFVKNSELYRHGKINEIDEKIANNLRLSTASKPSREERINFFKENYRGASESVRQSIASARTTHIALDVFAELDFWMDFMEYVPLEHDEYPEYTYEWENPSHVKVNSISMHGGNPSTQYLNARGVYKPDMYEISAGPIYTLRYHLERGKIDESDKINTMLGRKINRKIHTDVRTLLTSMLGQFDARDFYVRFDSEIKNLPTGNDIDLTATAGGKWDLEVFKRIFSHFDALGLPIKAIYCSPNTKNTLWDIPSLVTGFDGTIAPASVVTEKIRSQILETGTITNILGHIFRIQVENTLPDGELWISTGKPAGQVFEKPELADTFIKNDRWPKQEGYETYKIVGMYIPSPNMMNFARVLI